MRLSNRKKLLVAALVLTTGFGCVIHDLSRQMMFPGCPVGFPADCGPGVEIVNYQATDGQRLRGAWVRSGAPDAGAIVFFHGNAESASQNVPFGRELAQKGWDVFLAEYRGYAGLPGSPSEQGLYLDGAAALAAMGVPDDRLVLAGRSLGTGVAMELASRGRGRALVLVSPYTSMVDVARVHVGPLASLVPDKFDSYSKIGKLEIPIVILHGTVDEVVPFELGKKLAARGKNVTFVPIEGHGHNDLYDLATTIDQALRPK